MNGAIGHRMKKEAHDRLREARIAAGHASPSDAAESFGWNVITYRAHEGGRRGLRPEVAARYAKAFRVSPSFILTGEGSAEEYLLKEDVVAALEVAMSLMCRSEIAAKEAAQALLAALANRRSPPAGLRRTDQIRVLAHQIIEKFSDPALLRKRATNRS